MAAERKKSISVPQRSEERVMVFYWSVKLERERHWVRFGVLLDRCTNIQVTVPSIHEAKHRLPLIKNIVLP